MLGIPQWAIGVVVIMLFIGAVQLVVRLVAPESGRRGLKSRLIDARDHVQGLDEIEARVVELENLKQRVAELEERVDFTERMLAAKREAQLLVRPPGGPAPSS